MFLGFSLLLAATLSKGFAFAETIQIPVDHFNHADTRTYSNRFWVNNAYYQKGGPVFFVNVGEEDAAPFIDYYLWEKAGPSAPVQLAKRFHGLAVAFEHRYYGGVPGKTGRPDQTNGSYPVPMNHSGYASDYRYLTFEQALEDQAYFAKNFRPQGLETSWQALSPFNTPWIAIGGSYPGVLAATGRVRNPEVFFASWASSAPTQARTDMWTYYAQAERSLPRNCSQDLTAVVRWVDGVLSNGTAHQISNLKYAIAKAVSSGPGWNNPSNITRDESDEMSNSDIGNYMTTPFEYFQDFGYQRSVAEFCDVLETFNHSSVRTTDNGGTALPIASEAGIAATHNITVAYKAWLAALTMLGYDNLSSGNSDDPSSEFSWSWQSCSEFGFFQTSNPSHPHNIVSRFVSIPTWWQEQCASTFPFQPALPKTPQVDKLNKYGGWNMNPSNVMWTSGQYDPWRSLSPASTDWEIGAPRRISVPTPPTCGVPPDNGTLFGIVYADEVHASDMRALFDEGDPYHQGFNYVRYPPSQRVEPFFAGLGLFELALQKWLPCFRPHAIGN